MTLYIHYYFKNSGIDVREYNLADALVQAQVEIEARFKQAVSMGGDPNSTEAQKLMAEMLEGKILGQPLSDMIKQTEQQALTAARVPEGMDKSYASLGSKKNSILMAQTLAEDLGKVIADTNKVLDDLHQTLLTHYSSYLEAALETLKVNNNFSGEGKAAAREIVRNAINKKIQWVNLNGKDSTSGARLARDYVRLKQRVEALKILKDGTVTGYSDKTRTDYSRQLIGKIGGTYTNVGAELGEIAVAKAVEQSLEETAAAMEDVVFEVHTTGGQRGIGVTVTEHKDSMYQQFLAQAQKRGETASFNKNDVTIIIGKSEVTAMFGLSVKVSGVKGNLEGKVPENIKVHDTNLATILNKAKLKDSSLYSDYNKYNIAAGYGATGIKSMKVTGLQKMWSSYVRYAVLLNLVDYLAGDGTFNNNSLYLVVNSKVYSMKDIVMGIIANPEYVFIQGGLSRTAFVNANRNAWVGKKEGSSRSQEEGELRSQNLKPTLDNIFTSTSVKIKIALNSLVKGGLAAL